MSVLALPRHKQNFPRHTPEVCGGCAGRALPRSKTPIDSVMEQEDKKKPRRSTVMRSSIGESRAAVPVLEGAPRARQPDDPGGGGDIG